MFKGLGIRRLADRLTTGDLLEVLNEADMEGLARCSAVAVHGSPEAQDACRAMHGWAGHTLASVLFDDAATTTDEHGRLWLRSGEHGVEVTDHYIEHLERLWTIS